MAPRKVNLALAMRQKISDFDDLVTKLNELVDIYEDSEYGMGEANEITTADVEGLDITPQNLNAVTVFVENINLFLNNGDPMVYDYAAAINKFRSMPDGT